MQKQDHCNFEFPMDPFFNRVIRSIKALRRRLYFKKLMQVSDQIEKCHNCSAGRDFNLLDFMQYLTRTK